MPVKAVDDGLLEIDGGLDGAAGDEQHLHDGADEACPAGEVLELVLDVLPGRIAAWSELLAQQASCLRSGIKGLYKAFFRPLFRHSRSRQPKTHDWA